MQAEQVHAGHWPTQQRTHVVLSVHVRAQLHQRADAVHFAVISGCRERRASVLPRGARRRASAAIHGAKRRATSPHARYLLPPAPRPAPPARGCSPLCPEKRLSRAACIHAATRCVPASVSRLTRRLSGAPRRRTHVSLGLQLRAQLHQRADALRFAVISGVRERRVSALPRGAHGRQCSRYLIPQHRAHAHRVFGLKLCTLLSRLAQRLHVAIPACTEQGGILCLALGVRTRALCNRQAWCRAVPAARERRQLKTRRHGSPNSARAALATQGRTEVPAPVAARRSAGGGTVGRPASGRIAPPCRVSSATATQKRVYSGAAAGRTCRGFRRAERPATCSANVCAPQRSRGAVRAPKAVQARAGAAARRSRTRAGADDGALDRARHVRAATGLCSSATHAPARCTAEGRRARDAMIFGRTRCRSHDGAPRCHACCIGACVTVRSVCRSC